MRRVDTTFLLVQCGLTLYRRLLGYTKLENNFFINQREWRNLKCKSFSCIRNSTESLTIHIKYVTFLKQNLLIYEKSVKPHLVVKLTDYTIIT